MQWLKLGTRYKRVGGGPAPLLLNRGKQPLVVSSICHAIWFLTAFLGIMVATAVDADIRCAASSQKVPFLILTLLTSLAGAMFVFVLARRRMQSEKEWSKWLTLILLLAVAESGVIIWGAFLLMRYVLDQNEDCYPGAPLGYLGCVVVAAVFTAVTTVYSFVALASNLVLQLVSLSNFV